jgi:hypothetical protein
MIAQRRGSCSRPAPDTEISEQATMRFTEPDGLLEATPTIYRVEGLRYYLIVGETSWLDGLRIIDWKRRIWADRELTFYGLGASHALSIRHQDKQVTELLSCSGTFRKDQCLSEMAVGEAFEIITAMDDMRYSFRLTLHSLRGDDALLGCYPEEDQISIAYPRYQDFGTPITRIGWIVEPRAVRLETLHTYPEDCSAVRTESIIEIS